MKRFLAAALLVIALAAMHGTPGLQAQSTGTVTGRVTNASGGAPLQGVQVSIASARIGAVTDREGRYIINAVPTGAVTVTAELIGYSRGSSTVNVAAGATAVADFALSISALALDAVVVTGTAGGTQRRAVGNVVSSVNAEAVMATSPITNVDQLMGQRTAGLMMMPGGGNVGTGSAVRIRGVSSMSLSNDPIVYIDGVRMESDPRRGPGQRGGSAVSRLNDLNPNDIASIEVIKGPAAATLYGTEASNGVIQIITKRGATGAPAFDVSMRVGQNWLWDPETRADLRWGRAPGGELVSFNPYLHEIENGNGPMWENGLLMGMAASVRGGTDAVRYFASGSYDDDTGVVPWNTSQRFGLRTNIEMVLTDKFTLRTSAAYIQSRARLPAAAIDVDPFSQLIWASPLKIASGSRGFYTAPPEEWSDMQSRAQNDRTTLSTELRFHPVSWSTHRLIAGLDLNDETESALWPRQPEGSSHYFGNLGLGSKNVARGSSRVITLDYAGSADITRSDFVLTPSIGFQYFRRESEFITASGQNFPAVPITTVTGGAVRTGGETWVENATVGVYVQQQVGWKNRLFATAAVRADDNSAFGSEFDAAIYPKASLAWVVNEEPFWSLDWVNQFRLRAAWGAAGQQPSTFDAARLYTPTVGFGDQPALQPSAFGNPALKPERGEELELGFDASFLDGRVTVEFTRFDRRIRDAIVNRPLPPSSGFSGSQIVNIGEVSAWGNEIGVRSVVLESDNFAWDLDTQLSTMGNEIIDLGGAEFIGAGGQAQHRVGFSLADIFMRKIVSAEIDGGGFVTEALCDGGAGRGDREQGGAVIPCAGASQVLWGHSQPTWQFGTGSGFTLWDRLRLYARVEGAGGHWQLNTEVRAQHNLGLSRPVLERTDPMLMAYRSLENDATGAYRADFLRLREVSASYTLTDALAGRLGARGGMVSLGMRNVMMLWTKEEGWGTPRNGSIRVPLADMLVWDPEVSSTGELANNYQTVMPPTASLTLSVRLQY
ncbi:MAG TPA: SusC/RagA family TonB-linked outer membrane protein [Longimicrobiales bacterium]|nr:SusC/RagA family TonB-linked outer membrane protein [Longimicrobiales bacterium]